MFKRFCILTLCLTLAVCTALGGIVFVIDPFNVYRADSDLKKIIYQIPYYQNTGIARHAKYDTLITGSSMTQNFRAWWFNEKFGCNAVRLSFDGGILQDFDALLTCALKSGNPIKAIYFGLDNYLITDDSKLNDIKDRVPTYLYDDNPLNDVNYLLNKDILFSYIPTYFSYKRLATYDFYEMNAWDTTNPEFSEAEVYKSYCEPEAQDPVPEDEFIDESDVLLDTLLKYIRENPDISFTFFAPPYSKLYWNSLKISGKLTATVAAMKHVYGELLKNENVRLFYFQNDFERIENLNNYKDETHYRTEYNEYMLDCFVSGERELTSSTYAAVLDQMVAYGEHVND